MKNNKVTKSETTFKDVIILCLAVAILIIGTNTVGKKDVKYRQDIARTKAREEEEKANPKPKPTSTDSEPSTTSYGPTSKEKQVTFAIGIKQALNAPGLPLMCEKAYFNDLGELIVEVNGEWIILDDGLKEDMIYAIKELLKEKRSDLNVEGYGQFFSTSGQPLESFYAK